MLNSIADHITRRIGTMWCAIAFTILALVSLPAAIHTHNAVIIIGWIAQTFLQLVLLPIIMVSQNIQSTKTELLIREMHDVVISELGHVHRTVSATHQAVAGEQPTNLHLVTRTPDQH